MQLRLSISHYLSPRRILAVVGKCSRHTFYLTLTMAMKRAVLCMRLTYLPKTFEADAAVPAGAPTRFDALPARLKKCLGAMDFLDADTVITFFAAGAVLRVAGLKPIVGRAAIRRALVQFLLEVEELRHVPVQVWTAGGFSIFEADITMTLSDHSTFAFPATYIMRWAGGLIEDARVDVYLESRLAVAMSTFDRLRFPQAALRRPA